MAGLPNLTKGKIMTGGKSGVSYPASKSKLNAAQKTTVVAKTGDFASGGGKSGGGTAYPKKGNMSTPGSFTNKVASPMGPRPKAK